jgi:hypothetical protein
MVIRVRRQTAGEVDAPAIQELAAGRDSDEHRRVTVLGDADGRMLHSRFHHVLLPSALKIERRVVYNHASGPIWSVQYSVALSRENQDPMPLSRRNIGRCDRDFPTTYLVFGSGLKIRLSVVRSRP